MPSITSRVFRVITYFVLAIISIASGILVANKYIQAKKKIHSSRIVVGSRFPQDLEWKGYSRTLVLSLQKGCKYCSDSTEFYQRLVSKSDEEHVRVVAIMPQEIDEARQYLEAAQINISEVRQTQLSSLGILGTPCLFMIGNNGN